MNAESVIAGLNAVIAVERADGCPMADPMLIAPALRRWRSYDRRFKRHRAKSLAHRAGDLEKGLLRWYIEQHDYGYDRACLRHLAQSFAKILFECTMGAERASPRVVSAY